MLHIVTYAIQRIFIKNAITNHTFPNKFPNEYSDVIFVQIDQHSKMLLKKYKGVPILWNTVYNCVPCKINDPNISLFTMYFVSSKFNAEISHRVVCWLTYLINCPIYLPTFAFIIYRAKRWDEALERPNLNYSELFDEDVGQVPGIMLCPVSDLNYKTKNKYDSIDGFSFFWVVGLYTISLLVAAYILEMCQIHSSDNSSAMINGTCFSNYL